MQQKNKFDMVICLRMGKTSKAKTLPIEFKVTIYQPTVEPLPQYTIGLVM